MQRPRTPSCGVPGTPADDSWRITLPVEGFLRNNVVPEAADSGRTHLRRGTLNLQLRVESMETGHPVVPGDGSMDVVAAVRSHRSSGRHVSTRGSRSGGLPRAPAPAGRGHARSPGVGHPVRCCYCPPLVDRTLVIVKPDGVERGLIGEIVSRLERKNLRLVAAELRTVTTELARGALRRACRSAILR